MLQITKGLDQNLFIPVGYINDNGGTLERGAFSWDAGDNVLITLITGKTAFGYQGTADDNGVKFALSGEENSGIYKVILTVDRGASAFTCVVDTLVITDKISNSRDTLNGVYFYAQNGALQFVQAYADSDQPATAGNIAALRAEIARVSDVVKTVNVTHLELVALRDAGKLVAGQSYRITDYTTTTTQEGTSAAGHDFDIIVKAVSKNELSEEAHAAKREGDEYFNRSNLNAWRVSYCLDNDTARFAWADEGGKGVIYRMVDEWENECPYDFKNIMFKRYFDEDAGCYKKGDSTANKWCYTFCMLDFYDNLAHDVTVEQEKYISDDGMYYHNHGNKINPNYDNWAIEGDITKGAYKLNDNVFVTDTNISAVEEDYSYGEFYGFYSNRFGDGCKYNTIGGSCYSNTFGSGCHSNTFGNDCYSNTFGINCYSNTFGNNCNGNTFGGGCNDNTFGNDCYSNRFGDGCYSNRFGGGCNDNTFGNDCYSNRFGDGCYSNRFGDGCYSNTFGNDCYSNRFGDGCYSNTFGNDCYSNTFGNDCKYNTFGSSLISQNYTRFVTLMDGVNCTFITCSQTTSESNYCQNVIVNGGIAGASATNRVILTVPTAGNAFTTTFGKSSDTKINV